MSDVVNAPKHYTSKSVECIEITENLNFNLGNAVKYVWRYTEKNGIEDLKKAEWYVTREYTHDNDNQGISDSSANHLISSIAEVKFDIHEYNAVANCIKASRNCNNKKVYLANALNNIRILISKLS